MASYEHHFKNIGTYYDVLRSLSGDDNIKISNKCRQIRKIMEEIAPLIDHFGDLIYDRKPGFLDKCFYLIKKIDYLINKAVDETDLFLNDIINYKNSI